KRFRQSNLHSVLCWLTRFPALPPGEGERGPEKGMRCRYLLPPSFDESRLGVPQGFGFVLLGRQTVEETDHELGGLLIGHLPQRRHHALGTGQLEGLTQAGNTLAVTH